MPFADRSPRFIFVGESSVLWELNSNGTGDHESSVRLPGLPPVIDPCRGDMLCCPGRSCLGLCLFQGSGSRSSGHSSGLDPARIISLRKPFPAPIRSWVCRCLTIEMKGSGQALRWAATGLIPAVPTCRSFDGPAITDPYSVFKGLMPRRSDFGQRTRPRAGSLSEVSHRP
jgi:hypothetical protein